MSSKAKQEKTLSELVSEYNTIATSIKEPVVKSFKDKPTAIKRIEQIQTKAKEIAKVEAKAAKKAAKAKPENVVQINPAAKAAEGKKPVKKSKPTEKDLLGEDDDDALRRKPVKKLVKKSKPTEKDLLGEDDDEEGPMKKSLKGKQAEFNYAPFVLQKEPREKSFRAEVLHMLEGGTTIPAIEKKFQKYWDSKGIAPKVDIHLRALEIIRLLRYQNGFGFKVQEGKIYALRNTDR